MTDETEVGLRLRALRKSAALSQRELAKKIMVSTAAITNYETGIRVPRDEIKIRIADFFEKTVQEIFFD